MKRWLRREVLMPILFLAVYGGALYLLYRKLQELHIIGTRGLLAWLFVASVVVYVILLVTTFNHINFAYLLERYDPGDASSIRRLSHKLRYRLSRRWDGDAFLRNFPQMLYDSNFDLEGGDRKSGMVFSRSGIYFWTRKPVHDRVLLIETGPINVFRVDQLLKDTIDQLDHVERPSRRNILVIAVRMPGKKNVASAAAGCVNYMGRFQSGTLFPVLVDINHKRMYYPINRHFITREHRILQNLTLSQMRRAGHRHEVQGTGEAFDVSNTAVKPEGASVPAPQMRAVALDPAAGHAAAITADLPGDPDAAPDAGRTPLIHLAEDAEAGSAVDELAVEPAAREPVAKPVLHELEAEPILREAEAEPAVREHADGPDQASQRS